MTGGSGDGDMSPGGEGADDVLYDLADWSPDQRVTLDGLLVGEGVVYRWEGGVVGSSWLAPGPVSGPQSPPQASDQLVVALRYADLVEELIDDLDHPDALDAFDDDGDDRAADVLSALYVASDVLVGAPANLVAADEIREAVLAAREVSLPYGLDASTWEDIARRATALESVLGTEVGEAEVADAARVLRAAVRPLV